MDKAVEEAWAQLVCTTDVDCQPFPIYQEKFTIGRAKACDISLGDNKLVSGTHCYIQRNNKGEVWLHDSSTNGTLLNMVTKLTKGESKLLSHGDEFFVVYKKNNEELNLGYVYQDLLIYLVDIGYVYQDMKELAKEEESDEETQEYNVADATLADEEINLVPSPTQGFKRSQTSRDEDPPPKRSKPDEEKLAVEMNDDKKPQTDAKTEIKMKVDESGDKQSDVKSSTSDSKDTATKSAEKDDALAESLLCIICQEILHDCISLQPCMHSFCAGCYSDWMERSNECPSCRLKAERINKNHIVNNLVEAYLKEHPDKKRPEEEIKELDSRNKITRDMLYPVKPKKGGYSFGEESDDYEDSVEEPDSDDDDDVVPPPFVTLPRPAATGHLFGLPFGIVPPPKTVCRQCPEYKEPVPVACVPDVATKTGKDKSELADNCDGAGPSTDPGEGCSNTDAKTMPSPPPKFVCGPMQNHYLCNCCLEPMPDRRLERPGNPLIRPQQCSLCQNGFCHLYWGCRRANCEGCLGKFNDFNFGKKCLVSLVLDNVHESEILKNYLESKNMSVKDLLKVCVEKKDSGEYTCTGTAGNYNMHFGRKLESDAIICYTCALRYFKELAYQYRRDIPKADLPEAVTKRPDCYWGKNCRTQRNKPGHAITFNHICEQTRTA